MKTTNEIKSVLLGLLILTSVQMHSQESAGSYKNAIGIRAGETSGLSAKHFINNNSAIEGILSLWPYTVGITGLYEKYKPIGYKGLNLYYGGGGHVNNGGPRYRAYYVYRDRYYDYVYVRRYNELAFGIDGVIGLEYKFKPVPVAISADFKPYYEISNYHYTYFTLDPSIGIKVTF